MMSLTSIILPTQNNTTFLTAHRAEYVMIDPQHNTSMNADLASLGYAGTTSPSSNVTISNGEPKNLWSFEFSVIMAIILSISSFMTILGNIMVLTVIYRHRGMRTRTNLFLVNLAIADFLVGLTVVPSSITTIIEGKWILGEGFVCSLNGWVNAVCLITSIHTLMYIGINKYCSVVHPLSNPIKLWHTVTMMVAAWIWGGVCATLTVVGLNNVRYKEGTSQCGPEYPKDAKGYCFHGIIQITVIVIPFCLLLFCYIQIFREIKRHSERLRNNTTIEEVYILTQQKKVAITLFIVLATFIIMALPYHIYATYTTIKKDKHNFSSYINPIAYCFLYLNSMCNPIIYAFRSRAFWEGYKEILCHTPNYVIRGGVDNTYRGRFSSIFSGRSRAVSQASYADMEIFPLSPIPILSPPARGGQAKAKLVKQKSLMQLIRSSHRSSTPSVIYRDGEMIIIKGGKIVSVRRESNPVTSPNSVKDAPFSNSTAHAVMPGLMLNSKTGDRGDKRDNGAFLVKGDGTTSNAVELKTTDEVHVGEPESSKSECITCTDSVHTDSHKDSASEKHEHSPEVTCVICKPEIVDEVNNWDSIESIKELSFSSAAGAGKHSKYEQIKGRRKCPNLTIEVDPTSRIIDHQTDTNYHQTDTNHHQTDTNYHHTERNISHQTDSNISQRRHPPKYSYLAMPTLTNMAAGIASTTTDILLGMPLTPYTRNTLTKSDMQLNDDFSSSHPQHHHLRPQGTSIPHALSSENLSRLRLQRLPSLEYLDPPIPIFRSHFP